MIGFDKHRLGVVEGYPQKGWRWAVNSAPDSDEIAWKLFIHAMALWCRLTR